MWKEEGIQWSVWNMCVGVAWVGSSRSIASLPPNTGDDDMIVMFKERSEIKCNVNDYFVYINKIIIFFQRKVSYDNDQGKMLVMIMTKSSKNTA
jgi:hypothetical protein